MEEEKREESGIQERTFFEQPQTVRSSPGGNRAPLIALVLIVLLALGLGGWFILKGQKSGNAMPTSSPTPQIEIATPEPTAAPSINKKEIKIEIQNGSGTPGDAAFIRDKLMALGFIKFEVGNASNQDNKVTQIAFSSTVPGEIKAEIKSELEKNYQTVQVGGTVAGDNDIKIVTGLRKGATPKPTATATPKPSASPTATPTPTQL